METIENKTEKSLYFEKLIEHRFISDIMMYCWFKYKTTLEIIHSEIDANGYDLIISYNNVNRYIQLKTSEEDGKTARQNLNISLMKKENPCVIWIIRNYDKNRNDFVFSYLFWGSNIGDPSPNVENYKMAKHTKADIKGNKKERPNIKIISKSKFVKLTSMEKLFEILFIKKPILVSVNESIGYSNYTTPNNSIKKSELKIIKKEHLQELIIKEKELKDMEILCNMSKNDLVGKYFDKKGNIYFVTGRQINRFTLNIKYFKGIYK
jgi:cell division protein FtsL